MNKINSIYGARKPPQEYEIDVNTPSGCKEEGKKCEKIPFKLGGGGHRCLGPKRSFNATPMMMVGSFCPQSCVVGVSARELMYGDEIFVRRINYF